ncbi:hypothetical protein LCGC14_0369730 [marine sediment metagenome]|uniref:Uncharacterized protein n=1 Tax=marine sediment metagenome TaxID=412755 RepID=A0A0F9TBB4_9ZZZZ
MKDCTPRYPHKDGWFCALKLGLRDDKGEPVDDRCLNLDYPEHCLEEEAWKLKEEV